MPRPQAMMMVLIGGTFMSFVGVLLRYIETADSFQILFYRSIGLSAIVLVLLCIRRNCSPATFLKSIGRTDLIIGGLLGVAFSFYIYSMQLTTIAVTLFLLTIAPFFAAVLGWIFAGDKPSLATWVSMLAAVIGVALMVHDGLSSGNIIGNLFAIASAFLFATMLVVIRVTGQQDTLGGTFIGGAVAIALNGLIAMTVGTGLAISTHDLGLSLFMGAFTIGIGIALVTWAASSLPPAEVSILVLIESVLGPLWAWAIIGEQNSAFVLIGGVIVMLAVVIQAAFGQPAKAAPSHAGP